MVRFFAATLLNTNFEGELIKIFVPQPVIFVSS